MDWITKDVIEFLQRFGTVESDKDNIKSFTVDGVRHAFDDTDQAVSFAEKHYGYIDDDEEF